MKKNCIDCKQEKEVRFFGKRVNTSGTKKIYRVSACKVCMCNRTKKWVANNKQRSNEYQKNYQQVLRRQQDDGTQDENTPRHE